MFFSPNVTVKSSQTYTKRRSSPCRLPLLIATIPDDMFHYQVTGKKIKLREECVKFKQLSHSAQ